MMPRIRIISRGNQNAMNETTFHRYRPKEKNAEKARRHFIQGARGLRKRERFGEKKGGAGGSEEVGAPPLGQKGKEAAAVGRVGVSGKQHEPENLGHVINCQLLVFDQLLKRPPDPARLPGPRMKFHCRRGQPL